MTQTGRTRWTWAGTAWLALPIAAWLVGILWFGGDLGRCTDDYSVNFRDPATGELPSPFNPWARYPFFWRPLHNAMCFGLGTLFAENWRVLIVFCAVMHGAACLAVYALLRTGTRARGPAAVGAMALLLHPMNFEVAFWFCSISAAIATALWCGLAIWCARMVCRERGPRAVELLGLAALALTIPCFYEQPASGVLALPFILLAAWLRSASGPRLGPAFWRAILLCGIAGAMNVVYIVLLRLTAPASFRGGSNSFVKPDRVVERIGEVAASVRWQLYGNRLRQTSQGAWETGLETLATPVGIAAMGGLMVLAIVWVWAWCVEQRRTGEERAGVRETVPQRGNTRALARVCWIAAGAILFVGAFVPIAMMGRQNVEPRTLYFPLVGLSLILAQLVDVLLGAVPSAGRAAIVGRFARGAVGLVGAAAVIAGCVCCVGMQAWCYRRSQRDVAIASRLAELVPDPPANAAYVPLSLDAGVTSTGYLLFDRLRPGAFNTTWSATALMQEQTRRGDVVAAAVNPWAKYPFDRFSIEGLSFALRLDGRASDPVSTGEFISWERAVPFAVDDDGRVRLVRQIEIARADERVDAYVVPVVRNAVRAGTARGHATTMTLTDSADQLPGIVGGWRWVDPATGNAASEIVMQPLDSRGTKREGVWLHPTYQNASRAAMQATIEPSANDRSLRFRLTTPPEDYVRFDGAEPVTVQIELFDGNASGISTAAALATASIELTRELAESESKWVPVDLTVPSSDVPRLLRVRIVGSKARGATHAPVWVTPGMWVGGN